MEVRNGTSTILGASKIYGVPRSVSKERAVVTEEYIKKLFNELKTFLTEQNNNSAAGFLSKWTDSDPNNFFPYVGGSTKM